MRPDITPDQLRYFLQEDLYLLQADKDYYGNPAPQPAAEIKASAEVLPTETSVADVTAAEITVPVTETVAPAFQYLGANQKNFLVLCCYPGVEHMADNHLTALTSTLNRLQFSIDDVAILNMAQHPDADWQQLTCFFSPQKLLILGKKSLPKGLPVPAPNQVKQTQQLKTLYTYSFNDMIGQKEYTKTFWTQIQNL